MGDRPRINGPKTQCRASVPRRGWWVLLAAVGLCAARPQDAGLNLDPTSNKSVKCVTSDGREGVCTLYLQCYANHSLAYGGNLLLDEVRDSASAGSATIRADDQRRRVLRVRPFPVGRSIHSGCGHNKWCCTAGAGAGEGTARGARCWRARDGCPGCVALYRPGGDAARRQREPSGLYCAGVLLSARVVLTSAACVHTVADEDIWARVPAAADPQRRYAVANRLAHPHYRTHNHANDFGLLVLTESVALQAGAAACVSLREPLRDVACSVPGFDREERVVMTALRVRAGDCSPRNRSIADLACGTGAAGCSVAPGAPVLCAADGTQGGHAVAGVARRPCAEGAAQLGRLQEHAAWLQKELTRLGLPSSEYAV
ncbi:uncharacterized protein [Battus philenor]|uniref:uncharacterized protein n=1 Tax=Battus philenor TaxID=42288 RepID=UPI0035D12C7B